MEEDVVPQSSLHFDLCPSVSSAVKKNSHAEALFRSLAEALFEHLFPEAEDFL
jgi:hypothetical protein